MRIAVPGAGTPILELLHEPDAEQLRFSARAWGNRLGTGRVSRSYAPPYALVAWHSHPVGVDIERVAPCDEHFARSICTPEEAARAPWTQDREIIGLWSGKEALAKALGDALRYDPRRLDSPAAWADGRSGPWRARALEVADGYCAWVCWRDPGFQADERAVDRSRVQARVHSDRYARNRDRRRPVGR